MCFFSHYHLLHPDTAGSETAHQPSQLWIVPQCRLSDGRVLAVIARRFAGVYLLLIFEFFVFFLNSAMHPFLNKAAESISKSEKKQENI